MTSILIAVSIGSASLSTDTLDVNSKSNYEIAFTPRVSFYQTFKISPTRGVDYSDFNGIMRLQLGRRIISNNYLHVFCDLYFRKTTDQNFRNNYHGYVAGLQYERKMQSELVISRKFKWYSKGFYIKFYPNLLITYGLTRLNSGISSQGLNFKGKWSIYQAYGTGLTFLINKHINLQVVYQLEYLTSLKSYPMRFVPMQTKLIYKL
ncbi:MAG: hypothetical protein ABIO44_02830 [Saprospiraceae bacterium]